jgi:hypothetical protein
MRNRVFPILFIVLVWFLLIFANFTPNTWLSGWDNLHPEFNFPLNIGRSLSASWQEYQGLGLSGGMAHAADLPRQIILSAFSLFLPLNLVRYIWTFLMFLVGPLGVYFLITKVFLEKEKGYLKNLAGLVAALFYLLNLATVQSFFTPFETFTSFYGFFPWLLASALNYLKRGGKANLVSFFLVSFFAISAFYVQTLFVVYLIFLFVFALEIVLRKRKSGIKRLLRVGLVVLVTNAFWLLPVIYFSFTNAGVLKLANQNHIATPETQFMNQASGSFSDVALLKGYWFNYYDLGEGGKFDYLYAPWKNHLEVSSTRFSGYVLFIASALGFLTIFLKKRFPWKFSGIFLLLLAYFMLASKNLPFGALFDYLSGELPLFSEIFRNVFTKWSVAASLIYSLGLSFLIVSLSSLLKGKLKLVIVVPCLAFVLAMFMVTKPAFEGELISKSMKVNLPGEYFELFEFFERQPKEARIAILPVHSFWGWNFYDWGYRGSGFLWYGIEQPILDRAFDVWSQYNEGFYNEVSFAVYSQNLKALEDVLSKYEVRYLLLDESVLRPGGSEASLYVSETKSLLENSKNIKEVATHGFLTVYRTDFELGDKFISAPKRFARTNVDLAYSPIDPIYSKYGTYVQDEEGIAYPFVNFDKRGEVQVQIEGDRIVFLNENKDAKVILPVENPVIEGFGLERGFAEANNCDLKEKGSVVKENLGNKIFYGAYDGGVSCDYFYYPDLKYSQGYVLRIKGENKAGRGLKIYLQNLSTNRMDLEELLPNGVFDEYYFILPKDVEESGYTLNVETRSFDKISSENVLEAIEFYPVPIVWLINLYSDAERDIYSENRLEILEVNKLGTAHYLIKTKGDGLMVLGQGFENGWVAFPWLSNKKLEHVKVNSWANGWFVPEGQHRTVIIYWPQYLEYFGLLVLVFTLVFLVIPLGPKKENKD